MKLLREIVLLALIAAVPAGISGALQLRIQPLEQAQPDSHEVTAEQVAGWPRVLWADARSREKFDAAHIPGAVLLNEQEWEELLTPFFDAWDPDGKVVVYCDSLACDASRRIADRLRNEVGVEQVFTLKGGWEAWQEAH